MKAADQRSGTPVAATQAARKWLVKSLLGGNQLSYEVLQLGVGNTTSSRSGGSTTAKGSSEEASYNAR